MVPYLRNPSHYHDNPATIQTKIHYNLEPADHEPINYTKASNYTHVERRTLGTSGTGYDFSSTKRTTCQGDCMPSNPVLFWTIAIFVVVGVFLCIIICICSMCRPCCCKPPRRPPAISDERQQVHPEDETQTRVHEFSVPESNIAITLVDRKYLIRSKLQYQVLLGNNKSNVEKDSNKLDGETEASGDGDNDSIIFSNHSKKPDKISSTSHSSTSSSGYLQSIKSLFHWSSRPSRSEDVCSICLEEFQPGQTICKAGSPCCNHPFHDECIESWLMGHDYCPLCRSNIIMG